MLVKGAVGLLEAAAGRLSRVLAFTIRQAKIITVDIIADRVRVRAPEIKVFSQEAA